MICRFPFQHEAHTCSCSPSHAEILLRNAEINERVRNLMKANATLLAQGAAVLVLSFSVLFSAGVWGLARVEAQFQSDMRR